MNRRNRKYRNPNKITRTLQTYFENNLKEYIVISIIFLIGLLIGITFVNNLPVEESEYITNYLKNTIYNLKNEENIDKLLLLKDSISKNLSLVILLWFMGSTVVGIIIVYLIILFRGFCLGYTISSIIFSLGTGKGTLFLLSSMFMQNLIFIPCIISLGVSSIKLYKSIMQDKRKENIKLEIIRHTIFSIFIFAILILSSILEAYVSTEMLGVTIQYL